MFNASQNKTSEAISLEKQNEILRFAEKEQIELVLALDYFGHSFDELRYERNASKRWNGNAPKSLCDFQKMKHDIPIVSFFTGCGGIDLGFEAAGFKHIAAFEFNELFCKTLRKNRPHWNVYGPPSSSGDVSKTSEVIETLKSLIPRNFEGIFVGGPPCQPFSIASNQRFAKSGENFKRVGFDHQINGNLLCDLVSIIEYFKPACFLIENVLGLRDIDRGKQLSQVIEKLENAGYMVENPTVLNAANYGVPQYRERLFVAGNRKHRKMVFPIAEDIQYGAGSVLHREQGKVPNNETRSHKLNSVKRYVKLNYGQRDQLGRVDRLDPCRPSKTVIAGGTNGGGRSHLHPEIPRTLSVRECARLQTFPDDYIFVGSTARQFTQAGNAVPPVLAVQLGTALAKSIFGVNHTEFEIQRQKLKLN